MKLKKNDLVNISQNSEEQKNKNNKKKEIWKIELDDPIYGITIPKEEKKANQGWHNHQRNNWRELSQAEKHLFLMLKLLKFNVIKQISLLKQWNSRGSVESTDCDSSCHSFAKP